MNFTVGIAVLGCGNVGRSVAERLVHDATALEARSGVRYELRGIAVRDERKVRPASLDPALFTYDAHSLIDDSGVDFVIECVGGTDNAAEFVERALERGRHVVTANKDLLGMQGPRLQALAALRNVSLRYEAAAGGAVPIVRTLREALAGDRIRAFAGVMNGTSTSILTAMESGDSYEDALRRAQLLGYAESDPANDVEGIDASHKLALLIQLAFGLAIVSPRIRRTGITAIAKRDVARAKMLGYCIRLVAAAVRTGNGAAAEVAPLLVATGHPFAQAAGVENAVAIETRDAGSLYLRGAGAGGAATASAVLGDAVSTLRAIGERHDFTHRSGASLEPALEVAPWFSTLPRLQELPRYGVWDDRFLKAPASQATLAFSRPGKERSS